MSEGITCRQCKFEVPINDTGVNETFCNYFGHYVSYQFDCLCGEKPRKTYLEQRIEALKK